MCAAATSRSRSRRTSGGGRSNTPIPTLEQALHHARTRSHPRRACRSSPAASSDVIHSFWVPNLHGKTGPDPRPRRRICCAPTRPGVYRGQCAEFCGTQHAKMALLDRRRGAERVRGAGRRAADGRRRRRRRRGSARGRKSSSSSPCALCHTIRGTTRRRTTGPDLTHFGGRRTIAAGTLPEHAAATSPAGSSIRSISSRAAQMPPDRRSSRTSSSPARLSGEPQ